jgi:hypothetical protein
MDKDLQTLMSALSQCNHKLVTNSQFQPLISIRAQLEYLIALIQGRITDRPKLDKIIIGIYAAREFESIDMDFANLLYEVEGVVTKLKV